MLGSFGCLSTHLFSFRVASLSSSFFRSNETEVSENVRRPTMAKSVPFLLPSAQGHSLQFYCIVHDENYKWQSNFHVLQSTQPAFLPFNLGAVVPLFHFTHNYSIGSLAWARLTNTHMRGEPARCWNRDKWLCLSDFKLFIMLRRNYLNKIIFGDISVEN